MEIKRVYPPEVETHRAELFRLLNYEASRTAGQSQQERRLQPIVDAIMDTENSAHVRCVLSPDDFSFLRIGKTV